jgi:phage-related minor tail protein
VANRIKGITIMLDGETRGLDKALSDVNKRSRDLQKELNDVQRLLKFDPGNAEALAQKQRLLAQQVENTTERLNRLRAAQQQVERQFERGGLGEEQFRAFRREIQFTETQLGKLKQQLAAIDDTKATKNVKQDLAGVKKEASDAKGAVSELGAAIAGIAAGGGIAAAVNEALDSATLETNIKISMDVPTESIATVKESVKTVTSYIDDQETALEGVRRQWALNANASDEANARIVKGAAAITRAYAGLDFTELIQETNEISKSFGISNDEALGLVNTLLKMGFPTEQLDIISEYGTQLKAAGYNAKEIQAIFAAGLKTGTWNIDNLLDGLKEGRIRLAEFGVEVPKATKELLKGTGISAKELQNWGKAVAKGGETGKAAMQQVAAAIADIDDKTKQNAVGVAIFGTMWEDQGTAIIETISGAKSQLIDFKTNQDQLNQSIATLDKDPMVQLTQAINELKVALAPLLTEITNFVTRIAQWVQQNPQLASTITIVALAISALVAVFMAITPIIAALATLATALGTSIASISAPVFIVIGALAALIAIGVLVWQNWDTIKAKTKEIWSAIKSWLSETWSSIKSNASEKWESMKRTISEKMDSAKSKIKEIWNSILSFLRGINLYEIGKNIIQGLLNGIASMARRVFAKVQEIANGIKTRIKSALGIASPSKVMMEFGQNTVQGFINGMQSLIPAVRDVSDRIAATMTTPSNNTITRTNRIVINNYGGGDRTGQATLAALRRLDWLGG